MCTVSVIPISGGYRLVHNRDEQRARATGEMPSWRRFDALDAVFSGREGPGKEPGPEAGFETEVLAPRDPQAGGTWLATSRTGVTVAVLNLNVPTFLREDTAETAGRWLAGPAGMQATKSRGVAMLEMLGLAMLGDDSDEAAARCYQGTRPCRTILISPGGGSADVLAQTFAPAGIVHGPAGPSGRFRVGQPGTDADRQAICWVSSGLGDDLVVPRMDLFERMVSGEGGAPTPEAQDAFHRHLWPDQPEISVRMSREDARTVSITTLEVDADGVRMSCELIAEGSEHAAGAQIEQ